MSDESSISYQPTEGISYDPNEEKYWDAQALAGEIERAFEICHGCRMCFKYCDSFPTLFSFLDDETDGDVRGLTDGQTKSVMDACFQCKLCDVQCPYTPRDNHRFQLDFPKLVHRYKAQETRRSGTTLGQKVLANPDFAGKMARLSGGLANVMNRVSAHRWMMEKTLGVHRDKLLPDFASSTFETWAKRQDGLVRDEPGGEAVLFQTCYVQNNEPQIGEDTVFALQHNQVDIRCAKGLECCGMPAWESGDIVTLRRRASHNLDILLPFVEAGAKVVAINPTCSMMMRRDYPELVAPEERQRAQTLAAAVRDPSEFLWQMRDEDRFVDSVASVPAKLSYHAPCHLRAQSIGFRARDVMRKIGIKEIGLVSECCGHDGTYAMKVEGFEPSQRIGKRAFEGMQNNATEVWATDCPLAAVQFEQHAGVKPMHPMTVLAKAYRGESFGEGAEQTADGITSAPSTRETPTSDEP